MAGVALALGLLLALAKLAVGNDVATCAKAGRLAHLRAPEDLSA